MKKVPFSDGSGHWFDIESAKEWEESVADEEEQYRNHHGPHGEKLFITARGSFVLYRWHWSMEDSYLPINQEKATKWLISNGYQKEISQLELQAEERQLEM